MSTNDDSPISSVNGSPFSPLMIIGKGKIFNILIILMLIIEEVILILLIIPSLIITILIYLIKVLFIILILIFLIFLLDLDEDLDEDFFWYVLNSDRNNFNWYKDFKANLNPNINIRHKIKKYLLDDLE